MTQKKKITINEVKRAYKHTGITPKQREFCDNDDVCTSCPLGALYFYHHPDVLKTFKRGKELYKNKMIIDLIIGWAYDKYGDDYCDGFVQSVDKRNYTAVINSKDFVQGSKEGADIENNIIWST